MRPIVMLTALIALTSCGDRNREPEQAPPAADTMPGGPSATESGTAPGGAVATEETSATTVGGDATAASSAEETGAPQPPGGYAVDSRPAGQGRLASIEYAAPGTVAETARFYDTQMRAARRVELDVAGDNVIAYGLSPSTSISAATTIQDVQRLLDQRSEPIVVVSPWTMPRTDPLIRDLRAIGQGAQADALLQTRSKVTVVYAIR